MSQAKRIYPELLFTMDNVRERTGMSWPRLARKKHRVTKRETRRNRQASLISIFSTVREAKSFLKRWTEK